MDKLEPVEIEILYEHTIKQIQIENDFINSRLNWMLATQGFLFAALAQSVTTDNKNARVLIYILPITGICLSVIAFGGVVAAYRAKKYLKRKCKDYPHKILTNYLERPLRISKMGPERAA